MEHSLLLQVSRKVITPPCTPLSLATFFSEDEEPRRNPGMVTTSKWAKQRQEQWRICRDLARRHRRVYWEETGGEEGEVGWTVGQYFGDCCWMQATTRQRLHFLQATGRVVVKHFAKNFFWCLPPSPEDCSFLASSSSSRLHCPPCTGRMTIAFCVTHL